MVPQLPIGRSSVALTTLHTVTISLQRRAQHDNRQCPRRRGTARCTSSDGDMGKQVLTTLS